MHILKSIGKFFMRHIEIPIIAFILTCKLYWFADELGLRMIHEHTLIVTFGTLLLLFSISLLFHRRSRLLVLWVIQLLASFIIYADLVYYRYFGDFITTPVLFQVGQASDISESITELLSITDLKFIIDLLIIPIIVFFLFKKHIAPRIHLIERTVMFVLSVLIGVLSISIPMNAYTEKYGENFLVNMWSNESVFNATGHLGFHAFETTKYLKEHIIGKTTVTEEEKQDVFRVVEGQQQEPNVEWFGKAEGKNVLMIQLESFENFVINKKINGQEITPNLNALIEETLYFSEFYHQTGQGRTSDAEFLTQSSLYTLNGGSVYVRYPSNDYDSLPLLLKEQDYQTTAYHSYDETFWNRDGMYRNYGFDDFVGKDDLFERINPTELYSSFETVGDEQMFMESFEDMNTTKPFYHFIVALTSHHPFTPIPDSASTLNVAPFEQDIFGDYLQSVNYVDRAVGTLVDSMKKEGLWEETVVAIYGDHDNGVAWNQEYADAIEGDLDTLSSYKTLKNVPFYLHIPGNEKVGEQKNSVGMINVAPTILELLGIEGNYMHLGSSMLNFEDHLVPFRDGSSIKGDVLFKASLESGACINLVSGEEVDESTCQSIGEEGKKILKSSSILIENNLNEAYKSFLNESQEKEN
ncbi:LTA synthase family protein [Paraliobacillus salinarum]|uniref:LTA synthase family protein n=1 Tax=Paraliobacillus salinarum TaxID=1158996 RepID=UPI0015F652FA|nr:LTA synthase family protein [Paraliobacillus salinarum]